MTASFSERLRYAAYAILAVLAAAAYLLLDTGADQPAADAARKVLHAEGLPQLRQLESAALREPRRDLFAFFKPAEPEIQVAPPPPAAEPEPAATTAPSAPDLLSDVQVDGVVRRGNSVTVLVRLGSAPMALTVGLGERFGAGDALNVQSVDGRRVIVFDNSSQTSRTFTLSEE